VCGDYQSRYVVSIARIRFLDGILAFTLYGCLETASEE